MGDQLLSDEDVDALCICATADKTHAVEYQHQVNGKWKTYFYQHKDCPLHGITVLRKAPVHANA